MDFVLGLHSQLPYEPNHGRWLHPPRAARRLAEGSWGANGDHAMWQNPGTSWTWERLAPLEHRLWNAARRALSVAALHPIPAQAARALLLAEASDGQFIISTGAATDDGELRFREHCEATERVVTAPEPAHRSQDRAGIQELARTPGERDQVFPDVSQGVEAALRV